jgi:hypothetical protein
MQIDESDEQLENARFSRRESLEPASNATTESAVREEKQPVQRISTDDGIKAPTNCPRGREMGLDSIANKTTWTKK